MDHSKRHEEGPRGEVLARAIATALLLAPGAILAQQSAPRTTENLEEVIVTGIRASLRNSLEVKRDAANVVDAISAEDVGDFPDKNIGEALQRVTGVQITRQDGEGRAVTIRGADPSLNRVEINGSSALSLTVGGGRDVDFRDIPVEFISRLEVVKSATPDMTEGGIGGTVRVLTLRPFDNDEAYLAGSTQAVYSDLADEYDPKLALIGSRSFFDNTLGVLLSATWEERHLDSHNARTTGWLRRNPSATNPVGRNTDINADGVTDWIPEIPRYIIDRRETERSALNAIVEWRPNDALTFFTEGTYARGKEEVRSMFLQLTSSGGVINNAGSIVGADNTVDLLDISSTPAFPIELAYRNINGSLTREQYATALGGKWESDSFRIDGRVNYSKADVQNDEKNSTATIIGLPRAIIDYRNSAGAPNFTFPGLDTTSGSLVNQLAAVFNPRTNTQDETAGEFNVEYKPSLDWLPSLKTGVRISELNMDSILYQRTIQLSSRTPPPASAGATTTVAVPAATITDIINAYSGVNSVPFFHVGDLSFGNGIRFWNDNNDNVYNATVAASGIPGGLDPYGVNSNPNTNGSFQNYQDTWSVEEKTDSAYVQATFAFEAPLPISATLGVRYVDTETLSSGFVRVANPGQPVQFLPDSRGGGYEEWLPSLNVRMEITEAVIARMTAGKVMARPNPNQLALRRTVDAVGELITRGNPDLLPFLADQYDLGVEWYFGTANFVSATLFYKDISRFITTTAFGEDAAGVPGCNPADIGCFNVTQPINGNDQVSITGIELGGQYAFDFLPGPWSGFGVLANVTYADDSGYKGVDLVSGEKLSFPGLSELSYNLSAYYENDRFSARFSYNWRDDWLVTAAGRGGLAEYTEAYGTLDMSASFNVTEHFTAFLEAVNLLDEQRIEYNNPFRRIGNETFGKRYFVGLRAKF